MKRFVLLLAITALALSTLTGCGSDKKEGETGLSIAAIDGGYIGTSTCLGCHNGSVAQDKREFLKSGHPYKYTHTGGAIMGASTIPGLFTRPVTTTSYINTLTLNGLWVSDGMGLLDWSAINYTVGGFGWKIRWGMRDYGQDNLMFTGNPAGNDTGYVWSGDKAQYNIADGSWSAYNAGKNKKYECAVCHNTNGIVSTAGYDCRTEAGTDAAPARTEPWAKNPGMGPDTHGGYYSSWTFDGVQCEACHGPGVNHATTNSKLGVLKIAGGIEICAKCHIRAENTTKVGANAECGGDSNTKYLTNGAVAGNPFISHHEQYNELVGFNNDGVHRGLKCTTCHDPHKRSHKVVNSVAALLGITDNNLSAEARGAIKVSCTECHGEMPVKASMVGKHVNVTCIDCHMAEATKSAINSSTAGWGRKADVKTHIFRIKHDGTTIQRTNGECNDGSAWPCTAASNQVKIATNYITPRYACGKCHDPNIGTAPLYSSATSTAPADQEIAAQNEAYNYHNTR